MAGESRTATRSGPNTDVTASTASTRKGLNRTPFELQPWVDASFLTQVLAEESLQEYWTPLPPVAAPTPAMANR